MLDDTTSRNRNVLLFWLTLAGLILAAAWIAFLSVVLMDPTGRLFLFPKLVVLAIGVLTLGGSVYTLKTTSGWRRWNDLRLRDKRVATLTIAAGFAGILFTCAACILTYVYASGLAE